MPIFVLSPERERETESGWLVDLERKGAAFLVSFLSTFFWISSTAAVDSIAVTSFFF